MVELILCIVVAALVLQMLKLSLRRNRERFRTPEEADAIAARLEKAWVGSESAEETQAALVAMGMDGDRAAFYVELINSVVFRVGMERGPMPHAWELADRQRFTDRDEQFDNWVYRALLARLRRQIPDDRPGAQSAGAPPEDMPSIGDRVMALALYFALVVLPLGVVLLLWWRQAAK